MRIMSISVESTIQDTAIPSVAGPSMTAISSVSNGNSHVDFFAFRQASNQLDILDGGSIPFLGVTVTDLACISVYRRLPKKQIADTTRYANANVYQPSELQH